MKTRNNTIYLEQLQKTDSRNRHPFLPGWVNTFIRESLQPIENEKLTTLSCVNF